MDSMIIPLNGWAVGERVFRFHADTEFFHTFDNTEILDADVEAQVRVVKQGQRKVEVELALGGSLTVPCDRCLEPLQVPVKTRHAFSVRFDVPSGSDLSEDGKEILPLGSADADLDLQQAVYDYACLALPIQRVHPEGACNPDTVRFLCQEERKDEEAAPSSPFAALKGLFDSK